MNLGCHYCFLFEIHHIRTHHLESNEILFPYESTVIPKSKLIVTLKFHYTVKNEILKP